MSSREDRKALAERFARNHPGMLVRQWHNGRRGWFAVDEAYNAAYEDPDQRAAPGLPLDSLPGWLKAMAVEVRDQDDAATSEPIYVVYQKRRIYGLSSDYTDNFCWVSNCGESSSDTPVKGWSKLGYCVVRDFCTAAFTRVGAEAYIRANGHNLCEPYIYVESGFRNLEWQSLRGLLLAMAPAAPKAGA